MASGLCDAMLPYAAESVSSDHVPRARVATGPASWRRSAHGRGSEEPTRPVPFAVLWVRPTLKSVALAGPCLRARAPQSDSSVAMAAPCTLSGARWPQLVSSCSVFSSGLLKGRAWGPPALQSAQETLVE